MTKIEVITHCWNYSRMLSYQVGSAFNCRLHPDLYLHINVACCEEDEDTMERLRLLMSFNCPQNVLLTGTRFERRQLMRRAIGRNQLAKDTKADIVWFADCDMTFGEGTFERIVEIFNVDEGAKRPALIFPRNISAIRS